MISGVYPSKVALLTAGGLAPCLSSAVAALIEEYTLKSPETEILCYLNGYRGLLLGDSLRVTQEMRDQISKLHQLGGSPIGNSRVKMSNVKDCVTRGLVKDGEDPHDVASQQLIKDDIQVLHTIGGDDTNIAAGNLAKYLQEHYRNRSLVVIGLPKTIDNDVVPVAQTLGANTAAEQAALFFSNVVSEHSSSPRMLVVHEVMGRHCGWLTAATALAYKRTLREQNGLPGMVAQKHLDIHAIYIPEMELDFETEVPRLISIMDSIGCVNIFVSEGAGVETIVREMTKSGKAVQRDPFGHVKLDTVNTGQWFADRLKKHLNAEKSLVQKSGYFCRAAPANSFDKDLVRRCAVMGVECARMGQSGLMGEDEERGNELRAIEFERVKGGKHFNTNLSWFTELLSEIGQPLAPPPKPVSPVENVVEKRESGRAPTKLNRLSSNLVTPMTAMTMASEPEINQLKRILKEANLASGEVEDLSSIISSIMMSCKAISNECKNAGFELSGEFKYQAEKTSLNMLANALMVNSVISSGKVAVIASQYAEEPIIAPKKALKTSEYALVVDPLDGVSNMNADVSIGSIWGIYRVGIDKELSYLQKGSSLIAAGYCLYGAATLFMLSAGAGVRGFTLDVTRALFILTHEKVEIPNDGPYYSVNEGYSELWDGKTLDYIAQLKHTKTLRYIGSMVPDIHRTIMYGGVFMYPSTTKQPKGKLGLVYECNPMAFMVEQAGGKAVSGTERVLDKKPYEIHQRIPVAIGSSKLIEMYVIMK
eukprot:758626_1